MAPTEGRVPPPTQGEASPEAPPGQAHPTTLLPTHPSHHYNTPLSQRLTLLLQLLHRGYSAAPLTHPASASQRQKSRKLSGEQNFARKNFPDDKKVRKLKFSGLKVRKFKICDIKVYDNALILA